MTSLLSLAPLFSTASPSERELTEIETCSALIAQRVARHRAELCSNGMTNHPPCRSLAQAMHDIRMKAESLR